MSPPPVAYPLLSVICKMKWPPMLVGVTDTTLSAFPSNVVMIARKNYGGGSSSVLTFPSLSPILWLLQPLL